MSNSGDSGNRFDWAGAQGGDDTPGQPYPTAPAPPTAPRRAAPMQRQGALLELATPVLALAAALPRDPGAPQPPYQAFRDSALSALRRIEDEAARRGVDREDAREACYALSLLLDEEVAESEWTARTLWAGEPLHLVLHQDPQGGVNFFRRLDALGDRQVEAKQVFLVCLAFGYRGRYAELESAQQAAELAAVRQRLLRDIHPTPMDRLPVLFPAAYQSAAAAGPSGAPVPRWWWIAGLGTLALACIVWVALFVSAGSSAGGAAAAVKPVAGMSDGRGR